MNERERRIRNKLKNNLPHFADRTLWIRPKSGGKIRLKLNKVQLYIHEQLEAQLKATGRVRAIIVKARQPGCSTYVGARYFQKVTHTNGLAAFILTHKQDATDTLFAVVDRFYRNANPICQPHIGKSNAKELYFDRIDSGYQVSTAGSKETGRSATIQLFHGSEVAFWQNAEDHFTGAMQAVPSTGYSEAILESTGNGKYNLFARMAYAAQAGKSEYILIFIPWFWHDEYRETPPADWQIPEAWAEYAQNHKLDAGQIYWATKKNGDLAIADSLPVDQICWRFRQEYPGTLNDAFQEPAGRTFVDAEAVARAKGRKLQASGALIFGIDVSLGANDWTWIIDRQGRVGGAKVNEKFKERDTMRISGRVAQLIDLHHPDMVFIDVGGGYGTAVYDRLRELGYSHVVTAVQFGGKPINAIDYANKRAEMWGLMANWFLDVGGASIPVDDVLESHILAPIWGPGQLTHRNSYQQIVLEKKEALKERLGFSPDGGDALGLTFAFPVQIGAHRKIETIDTHAKFMG